MHPRKGHFGRYHIRTGDLGESGAALIGSFMSAEVLAPPPPGWPEWVVTTKSRRLELGVTTNFSQVRSMRLFAGKRSCGRCTTCSARDAHGRAVIESLHAVQLRLSDDGGALTAISDSDT